MNQLISLNPPQRRPHPAADAAWNKLERVPVDFPGVGGTWVAPDPENAPEARFCDDPDLAPLAGLAATALMPARLAGLGSRAAVAQIEGDAMAGALEPGDRVVIDRGQKRLVSGVYAFRFAGCLDFRRVQLQSCGVLLTFDHPAYARLVEAFTHDQARMLNVVGRVVWPRV